MLAKFILQPHHTKKEFFLRVMISSRSAGSSPARDMSELVVTSSSGEVEKEL